MYRRLKTGRIFNRPVTKHAGGKVEKRARVAILIGIIMALAAGAFVVLYLASVATVIVDLLPVLIRATIVPLVIVIFYIVGLLDADGDIYNEKREDDDNANKRE